MTMEKSMTDSLRRATALVLVLLLVSCSSDQEQEKKSPLENATIAVGMVNDSPGLSIGTTKLAGFDVDLVAALGKSLNSQMSPTLLNSGDRDGFILLKKATIVVAGYSITPARRESGVDFAGPYMVSPQALIVRSTDKRFTGAAAVRGKRVCTIEGTTGAPVELPGAVADVHATTHQGCIDQVARGDADAVFTDELILHGFTRANRGKFKVVLPGVFGSNQYYGVGLLGGRRADCLRLNDAIGEYLRTQWRHDFQDTLQNAVAAYPGDSPEGDFESHFKPTESDMRKLSCQLP
jgi:glutamate transport system substrate-binding protein